MTPTAVLVLAVCATFVWRIAAAYLPLLRHRLFAWWAVETLRWQLWRVTRIADKDRRDLAFDRWQARCARLIAEIEDSE